MQFREPWSPTKDLKLEFVASKHTALWRKSKDWSVQNQDNVSEYSNMHNYVSTWTVVSLR